MADEKKISGLIKDQFPDFYRTEGPLFVDFVTAYYEWMESETPRRNKKLGPPATVAVVYGSVNVVGKDTLFSSSFSNGDSIAISRSDDDYEIFTIDIVSNNTFLTVTPDKTPGFAITNTVHGNVHVKPNPGYYVRRTQEVMDVDQTTDDFIVWFKETYLKNIQFATSTDTQTMIKNSLDLYRSKGTPRSVDLLFKATFGVPAAVYYPGSDLMRLSSGKWVLPTYLELSPNELSTRLVSKQLVGRSSGAIAFCDSLIRRQVQGKMYDVAYISAIAGNFITGEKINSFDDAIPIEQAPHIIGSLNELVIVDGADGHAIGDLITLTSSDGLQGVARVANTANNAGGTITAEIANGGYAYSHLTTVDISNKVLKMEDMLANATHNTYFQVASNQERVWQPTANITYSGATTPPVLGDGINMRLEAGGTAAINAHGAIIALTALTSSTGEMTIKYLEGNVLAHATGNIFAHTPPQILDQGAALEDANSAWSNDDDFTIAAANASYLAGETAYNHTGLGVTFQHRLQPLFIEANTVHCLSAIIEEDTDIDFRMGLRHEAGAAWRGSAIYTWSTNTLAHDAGTTADRTVEALSESGPNGGRLRRVSFSCTSNATDQDTGSHAVRIYPNGSAAVTTKTIMHHVQLEAANLATTAVVSGNLTVDTISNTTAFGNVVDSYANVTLFVNTISGTFLEDEFIQTPLGGNGTMSSLTLVGSNGTMQILDSTAAYHHSNVITGLTSGATANIYQVDVEFGVKTITGTFQTTPNNYLYSNTYNTNGTCSFVSTGNGFSFGVGNNFLYPETISYYDDLISDYLVTALNAAQYSLPDNPTANLTSDNIETMLGNTSVNVGMIQTLTNVDLGAEFNRTPVVRVIDNITSAYLYQDYHNLGYDNATASFRVGELVTQGPINDLRMSAQVGVLPWTADAGLTVAAANASYLTPDATAYNYTGDGSASLDFRVIIDYITPSTVYNLSCIIEEDTALAFNWGLYEGITDTWAGRARYTWSSNAITQETATITNTLVEALSESGPNGGRLRRVSCSVTSSTIHLFEQDFRVYPNSIDAVSTKTMVHHCQLDPGTEPLATAITPDARLDYRGLVRTQNSTCIGVQRLYWDSDRDPRLSNTFPTTKLVGAESGATANVTTIDEDDTSLLLGFDATFAFGANISTGVISEIEVIDSGFGYLHGESITFGTGDGVLVANLQTHGTAAGYYASHDGFLSNNKKLYDGEYWQNHSYEVRASVTIDKYQDMLKQVVHVAGTGMFGNLVHTTVYKTALKLSDDEHANTVTLT